MKKNCANLHTRGIYMEKKTSQLTGVLTKRDLLFCKNPYKNFFDLAEKDFLCKHRLKCVTFKGASLVNRDTLPTFKCAIHL